LLAKVPENRDVLLLRAVAQRQLGDAAAALATLGRLESLQPRFGVLFQERGDCHLVLGRVPDALAAFHRAVELNPVLAHSCAMLPELYRLSGAQLRAPTAAAQVEALRRLPPEVIGASGLMADGELGAAEQLLRAFLLRHGLHPEALRLLARIAVAHDR